MFWNLSAGLEDFGSVKLLGKGGYVKFKLSIRLSDVHVLSSSGW